MSISTIFFGQRVPHILAQALSNPPFETVQRTPQLSGSRFFFTVLAGLVLAFAFQMLLTNFSIALGISVLSTSDGSKTDQEGGGTVKTVGVAMGIWTLVSVSLALFGACALALRFSLLATPLEAITLALIIWATYFTALVWISSTTVGSLIGSVVNTATSSFQAIFGTAAAAMGAKTAQVEIVQTAEKAAAAIRRQVAADIDPEDLLDSVKNYVQELRSPGLDLQNIRQELAQTLQDTAGLDPIHLSQVNRDTFADLVRERTDLSKREQDRMVNQLERAWRQVAGEYQGRDRFKQLLDLVKTATPQQLLSDSLAKELQALIHDHRTQRQDRNLLIQGLNTLMGVALGRLDLSDVQVTQVSRQLKQAKQQVMDQVDQAYLALNPETEGPTLIATDVENYILNSPPWRLTRDRIPTDFWAVLLDPEADLATVKRQIAGLVTMDFDALLRSRGLFTQAQVDAIAAQLRATRQQVLNEVSVQLEDQQRDRLSKKTFTYLTHTPKDQLTPAHLQAAFGSLVADADADAQQLRQRFARLDRATLLTPLINRGDISSEEANHILEELQRVLDRTLAEAEGLQASVEYRVQQQWQQIQDYLRRTGKSELNPAGIQRDLETLLDDPQAGLRDLQVRLAQFDRDTLVQLLSQRDDLSDTEVQEILHSVEQSWSQVKHAPEILMAKAQAKYDQAREAIADYLRSTGKPELNPTGIKRDLQLLLEDPQAGYEAIYDRLTQMDRDTLVQLISQREDLSAQEVNRIIDQVQGTLQQIARAPRRLAQRTQDQLQSFQASLEDYLKSTHKEELNPEGIKRDVSVLLEDPRWGMERLGDRFAQMDRSTLVALLAQRPDMTQAEAEEVVDQIVAVRDQVRARITQVTEQVKAVLDQILRRIRNYLNGLERPELNYDEIRRDLRQLMDDPEAGFESLRDRLSHFDRETLVAVISSHDAIAEQDVNHLLDQIEATRVSLLQRAERVQVRFQERLETLKAQAGVQMEATRKAAAVAAWWLFATAIASGAAAAFGATLAL
ncbi:MFS transporter [Lyngbya confervoides]|uniref:MFS transporter n=1 Tax=Lyngbya confervoides BDU141951 TaxID=1574623 RepID=A0ABD4SZC3_9CYAN|nr:MFS transporter [Lyngbya confervoides]MCM1981695.1 MFS transporter [Lyngbya confervoides BDU141951]